MDQVSDIGRMTYHHPSFAPFALMVIILAILILRNIIKWILHLKKGHELDRAELEDLVPYY